MMNEEPIKTQKPKDAKSLSDAMDLSFIEKALRGEESADGKGVSQFAHRLADLLEPNLTALETVERMVRAALEVEFGTAFTLSSGFAKMLKTIAQSITTNPELRRQALAIASLYLEKKKAKRTSS